MGGWEGGYSGAPGSPRNSEVREILLPFLPSFGERFRRLLVLLGIKSVPNSVKEFMNS